MWCFTWRMFACRKDCVRRLEVPIELNITDACCSSDASHHMRRSNTKDTAYLSMRCKDLNAPILYSYLVTSPSRARLSTYPVIGRLLHSVHTSSPPALAFIKQP